MAESTHESLVAHLFQSPRIERAAYLFARLSRTEEETRLVVRHWQPVAEEDIEDASATHMRITARSYLRAMKRADQEADSLIFVHSHPQGVPSHSPQDDAEESSLFRTVHNRIHHDGVHASLVLSDPDQISGRVWLTDGSIEPISRIRVVGRRLRMFDRVGGELVDSPGHFDRQVRAFGQETQRLLQRLTVGVVGAGGTGSAVIHQLTRLGVGNIVVCDGQVFEDTNVNRVHGSRLSDHGKPKTELIKREIETIGLDTVLTTYHQPITLASVAKAFRICDTIFGCTDDEWGRSILTRLSTYYLIPVFDLGVKIDSDGGRINAIEGRVTTLVPGEACLFCRGRITAGRVAVEQKRILDPEGAQALVQEGYAPELEQPAPAVVMFTTAVASTAVAEMVHRLTGFLGNDRESSEVIHRFTDTRLSTNTRKPQPGCICERHIGRGDTPLFLNVTWPPE